MAIDKAEPTTEELEYLQWSNDLPEGPASRPWYKSIPGSLARGLSQGLQDVSEISEWIDPFAYTDFGKKQSELAKERHEEFQEEYLPPDEGFLEGILERGGRVFPAAATTGPSSAVLPSLSAGLFGEGAKEAGFGETGQNISEMVGLFGPSAAKGLVKATGLPKYIEESSPFMKKIVEKIGLASADKIPPKIFKTDKATQEEALKQFARRQGMTEKELNLAIRDESMIQDFAAEMSSKGPKAQRMFDKAYQSLGRVWDKLRDSPLAQQSLSEQKGSKLINQLSEKLSKLPVESRNIIQADFNELVSSNMKGTDLMNFWQDINYHINKGEKGLGILKGVMQDGFNSISPVLGADFQMTNKLYGNFSKLAEKMGPDMVEKFISKGEKGMVLTGVLTGNYPMLKKVVGVTGGRMLAREMIINPKLKNIGNRMLNGIKRKNLSIVKKSRDEMINYLSKVNAEAAMQISNIDMEELMKALDEDNQD